MAGYLHRVTLSPEPLWLQLDSTSAYYGLSAHMLIARLYWILYTIASQLIVIVQIVQDHNPSRFVMRSA